MNGLRRAALALYGLTETDRRLVLAALPAASRAALDEQLAELGQLGFDRQAVATALAAVPGATPQPAGAALAAVLAQEPPALVAQLLTLRDQAWRAALLAALPAQQRSEVQACTVSVPAPALREALESTLAAALAAVPPAALPDTPRRWWPWQR